MVEGQGHLVRRLRRVLCVSAEGFDTGLYGSASTRVARWNANTMVASAAQATVNGCPCPQCGEHDAGIVGAAAKFDSRNVWRRKWREFMFRRVTPIGVALAVVGFATETVLHAEGLLGGALTLGGFAGVGLIVFGLIAGGSLPHVHHQWIVHAKTPPGVTFGPRTPYREPTA